MKNNNINKQMKKILLLFLMSALMPIMVGAQGTPTDDTFTVSELSWDSDMNGVSSPQHDIYIMRYTQNNH